MSLSSPPPPPPDASPLPAARARIGVLLVDDDALLRALSAERLAGLGYRVESLADPEAALARLQADPEAVDVLITDEVMPGMSGTELAEAVQLLRPGLAVLLCTGAGSPPAGPVARVLEKPCRLEALDRAILALVGEGA